MTVTGTRIFAMILLKTRMFSSNRSFWISFFSPQPGSVAQIDLLHATSCYFQYKLKKINCEKFFFTKEKASCLFVIICTIGEIENPNCKAKMTFNQEKQGFSRRIPKRATKNIFYSNSVLFHVCYGEWLAIFYSLHKKNQVWRNDFHNS